jgi:hypothetical protein
MVVRFKDWIDEYEIQYADEETRRNKFSIFKANVELHGSGTYKEHRYALDALGYNHLVRSLDPPKVDRPPKVDWVEAGVVSPVVREQHRCGKCPEL